MFVRRKAPLHQEQGPFFLVLAAPHLDPGRFHRLAQKPEQIFQQSFPVEIAAYLQGEVIGAYYGVKEQGVMVGALIRREGVAFQNQAAGAGFLVQDFEFPASYQLRAPWR
jgi:hypothetical protein